MFIVALIFGVLSSLLVWGTIVASTIGMMQEMEREDDK